MIDEKELVTQTGFHALLLDTRKGKGWSQSKLAKQAGVSNNTIVKYEACKFGELGHPQGEVVVKLALALDVDPKDWLDAAGLKYSVEMVKDARLELDELKRGKPQRRPILRQIGGGPIRAEYLDLSPPFNDFVREHIELLAGLIDYRWVSPPNSPIVKRSKSIRTSFRGLADGSSKCHVLLSVLEVPGRLSAGFEFIPYPGWVVRLGALVARRPNDPENRSFDWSIVEDPTESKAVAISVSEDASESYLRGVCGYTPDKDLFYANGYSQEELQECIQEELGKSAHGNRPIILVLPEHLCLRQLRNYPEAFELVSPNKQIDADDSALPMAPFFRLGMAIPKNDDQWKELLVRCQETMFRNFPQKVANIYAKVLAKTWIEQASKVRNTASWNSLIDKGELRRQPHADWFLKFLKFKIKDVLQLDFKFSPEDAERESIQICGRLDINQSLSEAH